MLVVVAFAAFASYEVGVSQMRSEVVKLEERTTELQTLGRTLNEQLAAAQQRVRQLEQARAELELSYRDRVPTGFRRDILELLDRKLAQGVSSDRIAFVLRETRGETSCEGETETEQVHLQTPNATVPPSATSFADNRITITGSGSSARNEDGQPEPWFDPEKPIGLRILTVSGELQTARGVLPLAHSMVLNDEELRFLVKPGDAQGFVDITMQICEFP